MKHLSRSLSFISVRRSINKDCVCAPLGYIMEYYVTEIPRGSDSSLPPLTFTSLSTQTWRRLRLQPGCVYKILAANTHGVPYRVLVPR